MIDSLMSDIGIDGSNLAQAAIFRDANDMARAANESQRLADRLSKEGEDTGGDAKDGATKGTQPKDEK